MNISGILVITPTEHLDTTVNNLQKLSGIDIHFTDETTGRIVITQEAETISDEVNGLKKIRALPHIVLAEMSCHYFEDDHEMIDAIPTNLDGETLQNANVTNYLND